MMIHTKGLCRLVSDMNSSFFSCMTLCKTSDTWFDSDGGGGGGG